MVFIAVAFLLYLGAIGATWWISTWQVAHTTVEAIMKIF